MISPASGLLPAMVPGDPQPKNLKEAGEQFEALLMAQMLKSMREASSAGWLGTGDDEAGACMQELAEEHLAQALAAQGGLGLAALVARGLESDGGASGAERGLPGSPPSTVGARRAPVAP